MNDKLYPLKGFEEDYKITKSGKIFSVLTNKFLKPDYSCKNYGKVKLMDRRTGRPTSYFIHRLVAIQFLKNPRNLPEVNHKDGNHLNNSVYNLEWCTAEYNKRHAIETGLYKTEEDSPCAKLTKDQVIEIYKLGEQNLTKTAIAKQYNVSDSLIGEILRGIRWSSTFKEYYGIESSYKKPRRKKISTKEIKAILYDYYVNLLNTIDLQKKYKYANSFIGKIVKGELHQEEVNKCLLEIKELLDNQQPHSSNLEQVQRLKSTYPKRIMIQSELYRNIESIAEMTIPQYKFYTKVTICKEFESDAEYTWDVVGSSRRNIPLVEARNDSGVIDGDEGMVGANTEPFYLVFAEDWFARPIACIA